MRIIDNNLEVLKKKYPVIAKAIKENRIDELNVEDVLDITIETGEHILGVNREGYYWRLNSILDPKGAATIYADRYSVRKYKVFFVFGFNDGRHIRELLKKCDITNRMVVIEPDNRVFKKAVQLFDIHDILEDERVSVCILNIDDTLDEILEKYLEYSKIKLVDFCILPAYDMLYSEMCEKTIQRVIDQIEKHMVNENTHMLFNRMMSQNILFNMKQTIMQRNLVQMSEIFKEIDFEKIPVIIVSAGPSLDKNIHELKKAEGKAFIMCVDAALRALVKAGIRPDVVCSIDPEVPDRFFDGIDLNEMNWCCNRQTRPWVLQHGQKFIFYHGWFNSEWNTALTKVLGYRYPVIEGGGSVSTEVFQIAVAFGFKKVILVGQDLAFTNGVSHTKGIEGAFGDNDKYIESRYRVMVEGLEGEELETDYQMWIYKRYMEKRIEEIKDRVTVIDATEGGAKIEGTLVQKLSDTIERECKQPVDFYKNIRKIPPAYEGEQCEFLEHELKELKVKMKELGQEFQNILSDLEIQKEVLLNNSENHSVEKLVLQKILELNKRVHKDVRMDWIEHYSVLEEHALKDKIYVDEDIKTKDLLEQTLILYKSYSKSVDLFIEDYEEYVEGVALQQI